MKLVQVSKNEWRESASHAEYRIQKIGSRYRVFWLNVLIGTGVTLDEAKEVIQEDIAYQNES